MAQHDAPTPAPTRLDRFSTEHPVLALIALILLAAIASLLLLYQQGATVVLYENF